MKCPTCDGQKMVVWTFEGTTNPAYPWTAVEDREQCPSCKGTGDRKPQEESSNDAE